MRTTQRLNGLKKWITRELCQGRIMKAPAPDFDITKMTKQEPHCYVGWEPTRPDFTGRLEPDPASVCPGILVMPNPSRGKFMEEKRFDRYNNVHRPKELGQSLAISILFKVYEPGVRLPGFVESAGSEEGTDMSLLMEGTEEGLFTLFNWMDDCREKLLGQKAIPETDLLVDEESLVYSLYTDQSYVVDKRPIYYGFVNVEFGCYAEEGVNSQVEDLLK